MKKLLLPLLAIGVLAVPSYGEGIEFVDPSTGITFTITNETNKTVQAGSADPSNYTNAGLTGTVVIPSTVTHQGVEYTVTSIGDYAFCDGVLTSVSIPATVTNIGYMAFYNCPVTTITNHATTPQLSGTGSIYWNDVFSTEVFSKDTILYVPESAVSIFSRAAGWQYFTVEAIVEVPVDTSFEYSGVWYTITGENTVKTQEGYVNNSDGYWYANDGNYACMGDVIIPATVTDNGKTYNVTEIGKGSFAACDLITSVEIPSSVTKIGESAFEDCYMQTLVIGENVSIIGSSAFAYCADLTTITNNAKTPQTITANVFNFVTASSVTLYVPAESVDAYKEAYVWKDFTIRAIGSAGGEVEVGAEFVYNKVTYTITNLDKKTVSVGSEGWSNSDLEGAIDIPSTVEYLGETYTVTEIDDYAFFYGYLSSITIPETVTTIGTAAFRYTEYLASVSMPEGLETINDYAFSEAGTTEGAQTGVLKNVVIPSTVTYIGEYAFMDVKGLETVNIPAGITNIEGGTFAGCTHLKEVTCLAVVPPTLDTENQPFSKVAGATLIVPDGSVEAYIGTGTANYQWPYYFSNIVGSGLGVQDGMTAENNAPVEYFNLQGISVSEPEAGNLYIVRQGNTIRKVVVK